MEKNNDLSKTTNNINPLVNNIYDKVFDVFYYKHKMGIFAYDLPCQHLHTRKIEMQCRSADELATTKFYCIDCETFIE